MDNTRINQKNTIPLVTLIFLFCLVIVFAYDYLAIAARIALVIFVLMLLGYAGYLMMIAILNIQKKQQEIDNSKFVIAPKGHQIIYRERGEHKQIHLTPKFYSNGHYEEPTQAELAAYAIYHGKSNSRQQKELPLLIEGQAEEKQRTVFDVVNTGVHFSLIGPTDSGKTTLANHIIDHIKASKTYVLDPHAKFNVWSHNCLIRQSYDDIQFTLEQAFVEMSSRYDKGPGNYESILLAIDEWPAIIAERPDCENYISRISREGRKVDVRLLLLSQSDQIGEIGLSVALRNNFVKIELLPELTQQNQATIKHWDKTTELISLAGPYERKLSREEIVMDLFNNSNQTQTDITAITKQVFDGYGGYQRGKILEIITNNGGIIKE